MKISLRRPRPVALGLAAAVTLSGCATAAQFGLLSKALQRGTIIARALTVFDPSSNSTKVTILVGWVTLSGGTFSSVSRNNVDVTSNNNVQHTSNSVTDTDPSLAPSATYSYTINFTPAGTNPLTRPIMPIDIPGSSPTGLTPSSTGQQIAQDASTGSGLQTASTSPTFSWNAVTAAGNGVGYLVTLAPYDSAHPGTLGSPRWTAMIDGSKHTATGSTTVTVAYGAKTDIDAFGSDLQSAMASASSQLKIVDPGSTTLPAGKYAWEVEPLAYTPDGTAFALGKPSIPAAFQAQ